MYHARPCTLWTNKIFAYESFLSDCPSRFNPTQMSQVTTNGSHTKLSTRKTGNVASLEREVLLTTHGKEFEVPDYSIKDILGAIPAHCYDRRLTTSFYYVFRDIASMVVTGAIANYFIPQVGSPLLRGLLWAMYTVILSLEYTGQWVMAHECGHQAFSKYGWVNDTVGWVLHSYLMVPYFSWKFSHGKHHKATGHLTRDMVFVPPSKEEFVESRGVSNFSELVEEAPLYTLYTLLAQQFGGWWMYLATNVTGQKYENRSKLATNHFVPTSPLFEKKDYWYIVLSDIGVLAQAAVVYMWYTKFGAWNVFINWFVPYIFTNHWLVFITYLQHTDSELPHYEADQWNFAKGAAATIDREFGFVGQHMLHDIIETHVLHHYCSRIPFYNAREATEAIKKVMGKHYKHSDENMWISLWKSARECQFVEGENGVKMFRNANNIGVKPTN